MTTNEKQQSVLWDLFIFIILLLIVIFSINVAMIVFIVKGDTSNNSETGITEEVTTTSTERYNLVNLGYDIGRKAAYIEICYEAGIKDISNQDIIRYTIAKENYQNDPLLIENINNFYAVIDELSQKINMDNK